MTRKMRLVVLFGFFFISMASFAQKPAKASDMDTSLADLDYTTLFNELDQLLDSLTAPRNFVLFNVGMGYNYFNYPSKESYLSEARKKLTYSPSLGFYFKNGPGIAANTIVVNDGVHLNPYQWNLTGSYDYLKNDKFLTGISFTHFFTKDPLPFYTSPLKNEIYSYFSYRHFWLKPSIALSYGWGSRSDYKDREEYITSLLLALNGFTRVNTRESINDFNVATSIRHDFYWLNVITKKDYLRFTPQIVFTSGTQKFGFNQTSSTYATIPRTNTDVLYNTDKVNLDDQLFFRPLSLSTYLKAEYSKGKFFLQPQLIFDYYFPANEKNLTTAVVMNAGVIF